MKEVFFWLLWFAAVVSTGILMSLCGRKLRNNLYLIPFVILQVVVMYAVCFLVEPLITTPMVKRGAYESLGTVGIIYFTVSFVLWLFVFIATQKFLLRRARRKLGWSPKAPKKK